MVNEYAKPVLDEAQRTSNDKEGMKRIVDMALKALNELDDDAAKLQTQRNDLMKIIENYNKLCEVLYGEELITRAQINDLNSQVAHLRNLEKFRGWVLEGAQNISKRPENKGKVKIEELERSLRVMGEMRWRNPKAAIASVLQQSGMWEKIEPGIWAKKKVEKE